MSALLVRIVIIIFRAMMTDPEMRKLIEGAALKVFAEVFFAVESDTKYREDFLALAAKLKDPTLTVEAKQNVLLQIQNLHSVSSRG